MNKAFIFVMTGFLLSGCIATGNKIIDLKAQPEITVLENGYKQISTTPFSITQEGGGIDSVHAAVGASWRNDRNDYLTINVRSFHKSSLEWMRLIIDEKVYQYSPISPCVNSKFTCYEIPVDVAKEMLNAVSVRIEYKTESGSIHKGFLKHGDIILPGGKTVLNVIREIP